MKTIRQSWGIQARIREYFGTPTAREEIKAYGASIKTKSKGVIRVAAQNTNGTHIGNAQSGAEEISAMETIGIDILGITETKLNPSHDDKMNLTAMINHAFGFGTAVTSSVRSRPLGYLAGGTATLIQGNATGRIAKRISDPLGRFSGMALRGKEGPGAVFLTVYRVCQKKARKQDPTRPTCIKSKVCGSEESRIQTHETNSSTISQLL